MKEILDLQYSQYENTLLDIYVPETKNFQTVLFFHGGGLIKGDKRSDKIVDIAQSFTDAGYAFVSVQYRMYPNAKFPDYIEDCARATAFVKKYVQELGGNGELVLSGQSAGAWLALMLCMDKHYLANEGIDSEEIKGWFIDSAQTTAHFNVLMQETGAHRYTERINEYAPLYFLNENTKFSRMMLLLYDQDIACRYEQNQLFYRNVLTYNNEAKIEYKVLNGKHCSSASLRDENGERLFVKIFLEWLAKAEENA